MSIVDPNTYRINCLLVNSETFWCTIYTVCRYCVTNEAVKMIVWFKRYSGIIFTMSVMPPTNHQACSCSTWPNNRLVYPSTISGSWFSFINESLPESVCLLLDPQLSLEWLKQLLSPVGRKESIWHQQCITVTIYIDCLWIVVFVLYHENVHQNDWFINKMNAWDKISPQCCDFYLLTGSCVLEINLVWGAITVSHEWCTCC